MAVRSCSGLDRSASRTLADGLAAAPAHAQSIVVADPSTGTLYRSRNLHASAQRHSGGDEGKGDGGAVPASCESAINLSPHDLAVRCRVVVAANQAPDR